jgi:hypothetical protein
MNLTKTQLKQLIKEELQTLLTEQEDWPDEPPTLPGEPKKPEPGTQEEFKIIQIINELIGFGRLPKLILQLPPSKDPAIPTPKNMAASAQKMYNSIQQPLNVLGDDMQKLVAALRKE